MTIMSVQESGFVSDPKMWVALAAFVISLTSLILSILNQRQQDSRWSALNAGRMELTRPVFQVFRELTRKEFAATNWGYVTKVYGAPNSIDKLQVVNLLRPRSAMDRSIIPNIDPVVTLDEANEELRRKGYAGPVAFSKLYRPIFYFKNEGKTDVENFVLLGEVEYPTGTWMVAAPRSQAVRVPAGTEINILLDLEVPIDAGLPEKIPFRITMSYNDIHGNKAERIVYPSWTAALNYWVWE